MTPSDFSVLLLAWDDADPGVAVLGGAALPPTLPLAYHLAAEQPVLALYPHLPAKTLDNKAPDTLIEADTLAFPGQVPAQAAKDHAVPPNAVAEDAEATEVVSASTQATIAAALTPSTTGVRPLTNAAGAATSALASLVVGLADMAAPATDATAAPADANVALPASRPSAAASARPVRSQWPTGANAPQHLSWSAPAAPYLGASAPAAPPVVLPVPPLVAAPTVREAADLAQAALSWPTGFSPLAASAALGSTIEDKEATGATEATKAAGEAEAVDAKAGIEALDAAPATGRQPALFDEATEEIGAAEANDLSAPEDDLTPNEPEQPTSGATAPRPAPAAPKPTPTPELTARTPPLDGLNARMIQYARQAAQLVQGRADFGVIYAPSWPAWLAALEIRNSSRRPLVLYAARLAADFAGPAERGWLLEVERMTLRRAHLILVPTEAVRQQLRAAYGTDTGEVRVVPAADEDGLRTLLHELATG